MDQLLDWSVANFMEIIGFISGIIYVFLSIKQNIWLWPVGITTSLFQLIVFYKSRIYADMGLQGYYVIISLFGWYIWKFGKNRNEIKRPVISLNIEKWIVFILSSILLYFVIRFILIKFTNSDVPNIDAFTTALSITGTYLLAKKYIENWYTWLIVNFVSSGLYIYKGLYLFMVLYGFLTVMSVIGLIKWKEDMVTK